MRKILTEIGGIKLVVEKLNEHHSDNDSVPEKDLQELEPTLDACFDELEALAKQVPQWTVVDGHHITRAFKFPDFVQALAFVNKVGFIAEEQGHHPDILLTWGKAEVTMWTHKINGLTESDFILAAKIDKL